MRGDIVRYVIPEVLYVIWKALQIFFCCRIWNFSYSSARTGYRLTNWISHNAFRQYGFLQTLYIDAALDPGFGSVQIRIRPERFTATYFFLLIIIVQNHVKNLDTFFHFIKRCNTFQRNLGPGLKNCVHKKPTLKL